MNDQLALTRLGLFRVVVVVPELRVADIAMNTRIICRQLEQAAQCGAQLALFPELCITGYSCGDLLQQSLLLERSLEALLTLAEATKTNPLIAVVGLPLMVDGLLFNCAAILGGGMILGLVPKTFLPNSNEFYEERWFSSANTRQFSSVMVNGTEVPFGADILLRIGNISDCMIGVELCEDLWAVTPPSGDMVLAGATVLLNLSASNETLGKAEYRRELIKQQSCRCLAADLYTSAGPWESSTDVVYSGHALIAENGLILAESERFRFATQMVVADIDLQRLAHERLKNSSFSAAKSRRAFRELRFDVAIPLHTATEINLHRPLSTTPFVPSDVAQRAYHCSEVFAIQSTALIKRLKHTSVRYVTLGLSGGLDSTLALLVVLSAFDRIELPREGIVGLTMPGFGTTPRTKSNAVRLAELTGITLRLIPIRDAVRKHFSDIGHDESIHDSTYENAQARERTQILMDIANQVEGLAIGTGDLSELALGWCTYNGDHMSMYNVNGGVPKTLVRYLVEWCAKSVFTGEIAQVLYDICATPITPELLPLEKGDILQQETEAIIGPYVLHDFFLYYTVRHLFSPRKIFYFARQAFHGLFSNKQILLWMQVFYERFFSQQFKRSAMPDGPKVGSVTLSPRGDWRMPSDASNELWVTEVQTMIQECVNEKEPVRTL